MEVRRVRSRRAGTSPKRRRYAPIVATRASLLDHVSACIFRPDIGIGTLGVVTVGADDHGGRPPLLEGIDELIDAMQAELERALALNPYVFADLGKPTPIPLVASAADIFELLAADEGHARGDLPRQDGWH